MVVRVDYIGVVCDVRRRFRDGLLSNLVEFPDKCVELGAGVVAAEPDSLSVRWIVSSVEMLFLARIDWIVPVRIWCSYCEAVLLEYWKLTDRYPVSKDRKCDDILRKLCSHYHESAPCFSYDC